MSILRGARGVSNIRYISEKWFFDNFWKTPNTKFIGCRFDECKFIRTDLRGETDQKFITSKFVNKNEFKDTQGVSTSDLIWLGLSRLNHGWVVTLDILCMNTLRLKLSYFIGHVTLSCIDQIFVETVVKIFNIKACNLVLAARWWCWWWCSILGVFGGAVGFNVIITGACRMRFPHGSNWTNKYALWWSFYCHDIFTLPATFIISRSGSFSDFMSLCR